MDKKILVVAMLVLLSAAIIAGCMMKEYDISDLNETETGIANPAAVYCKELGYEYKIITGSEGGQKGVCVFPDKSECDAWDFFTGKCGKEYTYCEMHGGKIITATEGCRFSSECAVCVLPNGTKINEWDYFRREENK
jgi:putative hemolysin